MYRNVAYDPVNRCMRLSTWTKGGERVSSDVPYQPYLYVENQNGRDGTSLFNTRLTKRTFTNSYERGVETGQYQNRAGARKTPIKRVFENLKPEQQFLIDEFWESYETADFDQFPLKIWFLDIEVYSPDEFPDPDTANHPINIITIYDSLDKKFISWGIKPYNSGNDDEVYIHCKNEREILLKFIEHMRKDHPDIISGWNSDFFDMPYVVRRTGAVLGADYVNKLSPVDHLKNPVYSRTLAGEYYKTKERFYIKGLSCVDYLDIYKVFSQGLRESYKLDAVAEFELGENKVDYGGANLATLADNDWDTFVRYNIQDVRLLVKLEDKLSYLSLVRMLGYVGLVPFESAMGTITVVTGAAVIQARKDGKIVPTFQRDGDHVRYEGAFVSEPVRGFHDGIVSFDANSLYPNTMISLNLSPETKIGWITDVGDNEVTIKHINGKEYNLSHDKFSKFLDKEQVAVTKAKVLFTQKQKGIFPKIADNYYKKRVEVKKELTTLKVKLSEMSPTDIDYDKIASKIERLDTKQLTIKILINRIYGYFGNKRSTLGDPDITRSITLTGQAIIKQSNKILKTFVQDKTGYSDDRMKECNPVIYNDTDSVYITIGDLLQGKSLTTRTGKISKEAKDTAKDIEKHLNEEITKWATKYLNTKDSRFVFKRESICDVGVFLQKKRYVLHVLDDEGIAVNKFKYTGVEVVRSTMPGPIKPHVKKIIENMLLSKDRSATDTLLNEVYDIFKSLPVEDVSFISGISKYNEYADRCEGLKMCKGMPIHIKSAYAYNQLLDRLNLTSKYESIGAGDKVRYLYVSQPNKYGLNTIGYKHYYPGEFKEIFQPNVELMFEKIIYSIIERFYEAVKWQCKKPGHQLQTDLFDLLKM